MNDLYGTHGDRRTVTPPSPRPASWHFPVISVQGVGRYVTQCHCRESKLNLLSSMYVIILCQRIQ